MNEFTFAFIGKDGVFNPAHIGEIKNGDTYYLIIDGSPSKLFKAIDNPKRDPNGKWIIDGVLLNPQTENVK